MSIGESSELLAYHAFVKTTLSAGGNIDRDATPAAFLEYQRQLTELQAALQPAAERCRNGESGSEVDIEELLAEILPSGPLEGESA